MNEKPRIRKALKAELFSVADVADSLQVSTKTIRRAIASGQLLCLRVGRQIRCTEAQVQVYLAAPTK